MDNFGYIINHLIGTCGENHPSILNYGIFSSFFCFLLLKKEAFMNWIENIVDWCDKYLPVFIIPIFIFIFLMFLIDLIIR